MQIAYMGNGIPCLFPLKNSTVISMEVPLMWLGKAVDAVQFLYREREAWTQVV